MSLDPEEINALVNLLVEDDCAPIDQLVREIVRVTNYPVCEVRNALYAMFPVGLNYLWRNEVNAFTKLSTLLGEKRSGELAAEFLAIAAPLWAVDHEPDGRLPLTVIMDRLDSYPNGPLIRAAKKLVQNLKGLN